MDAIQVNGENNLNNVEEVAHRKLSWPLIGFIAVLPWIGAFLTLRKGYSSKVRVASFAWLFVYMLGSLSHHGGNTTTTQASDVATTEESQPAGPKAQALALIAAVRQTDTPSCQAYADNMENFVSNAEPFIVAHDMPDFIRTARNYQCIN